MKKKIFGVCLASVMAVSMVCTSWGANEKFFDDPKAVTPTEMDDTEGLDGVIRTSLRDAVPKSISATVPIRIDMALVYGGEGKNNTVVFPDTNMMFIRNKSSENNLPLRLTNINLEAKGSDWTIGTNTAVKGNTTTLKMINMQLNGYDLKIGDNRITGIESDTVTDTEVIYLPGANNIAVETGSGSTATAKDLKLLYSGVGTKKAVTWDDVQTDKTTPDAPFLKVVYTLKAGIQQ